MVKSCELIKENEKVNKHPPISGNKEHNLKSNNIYFRIQLDKTYTSSLNCGSKEGEKGKLLL